MLLRALCAFMEARSCYLAALGARYGIALDTAAPSTHAGHGGLELLSRFRLDG